MGGRGERGGGGGGEGEEGEALNYKDVDDLAVMVRRGSKGGVLG